MPSGGVESAYLFLDILGNILLMVIILFMLGMGFDQCAYLFNSELLHGLNGWGVG